MSLRNGGGLRRGVGLVTGAALVTALAACGGDEGQDRQDNGAAQGGSGDCEQSLTVATVTADSGAQGYIADEKGFYEENGLDVEVKLVAGVPELAAAVQSGDAQVALTSATSIASAWTSGIPFQIVAPGVLYTEEFPGTFLMAAERANVDSVEDLAGTSIAVNSLNTLPHLSTLATLDDAGVDVDSVEFVVLNFPAIGQALESGQVQAGAVVSPFTDQIEAAGIGHRLVSPYDAVNNKEPFLNTVWFSTEEFINESPACVEQFRQAIFDTSDWANEEANLEERKAILQEYTDLTDEAVAALEVSPYGTEVNEDLVQPLLDVMERFGALEESLDAGEIIGDVVD
jgi:ABC-type nitrate/sulfonate/bicarbonate transport system substrate-binding protein